LRLLNATIAGWDPRGVGSTTLQANCFGSKEEENKFWKGTIPRTGIQARGHFESQDDKDAYYAQIPKVDGLLEELGQMCQKYSPNTLQYVGTVATVQDMVAMHDYLEGKDKPLNYWGLS
jgi:hypothetical protein